MSGTGGGSAEGRGESGGKKKPPNETKRNEEEEDGEEEEGMMMLGFGDGKVRNSKHQPTCDTQTTQGTRIIIGRRASSVPQ